MYFNPQQKPKHRKRPPRGRLKNKPLADQNKAVLDRDGHCCACCGAPVPYGENEWPIHHVCYQGHTKLDYMIFKMTVCPTCHAQLHWHHVWDGTRYVPMGSKAATQAWCCARIIEIGMGEIL